MMDMDEEEMGTVSLICEEDPNEVLKMLHEAEDRGEFAAPVMSMFDYDIVECDTDGGRPYIPDDLHRPYDYLYRSADCAYDTVTARFVEGEEG